MPAPTIEHPAPTTPPRASVGPTHTNIPVRPMPPVLVHPTAPVVPQPTPVHPVVPVHPVTPPPAAQPGGQLPITPPIASPTRPPRPHREHGDYYYVEGWDWYPQWFPYWEPYWYWYWLYLYYYYGGDDNREYAEWARDWALRQIAPQWGWL